MPNLKNVQEFWEENPLWTGESKYEPYTYEFYNEHREIYIKDCFSGKFDSRFLPKVRKDSKHEKILDLIFYLLDEK